LSKALADELREDVADPEPVRDKLAGPMRPRASGSGLLAVLVALAGCGGRPPAPAPPPGLVLVVVDTWRADRLSLYGGPAPVPALEELADEGAAFEAAWSHVPATAPSVATLLTSRLPHRHGVRVNGLLRLRDEATTLAEVLAAAGFRTGAVVSSFVLDPRFGLAQGFASFDADFTRSVLTREHAAFRTHKHPDFEQRADEATDKALAWLRATRAADGAAPFFLLVHYFDPHWPYAPPQEHLGDRHPYDGEVAWTDVQLGRFLAGLRELGVYDAALVAVVGDHGEILDPGPRGSRHGGRLEDVVLRVPLVVRPPGGLARGVRVAAPVGLVDLAPTLLALLGLPPERAFEGRSFAGLLAGDAAPPREVLPFETLYWKLEAGGGPVLTGARGYGLKYVRREIGGRVVEELYDTAADPAEARNLLGAGAGAGPNAPDVARLRVAARAAAGGGAGTSVALPLDPATEERLRSLGYLGQ
jgi:arylsulfatase A-like enzyme